MVDGSVAVVGRRHCQHRSARRRSCCCSHTPPALRAQHGAVCVDAIFLHSTSLQKSSPHCKRRCAPLKLASKHWRRRQRRPVSAWWHSIWLLIASCNKARPRGAAAPHATRGSAWRSIAAHARRHVFSPSSVVAAARHAVSGCRFDSPAVIPGPPPPPPPPHDPACDPCLSGRLTQPRLRPFCFCQRHKRAARASDENGARAWGSRDARARWREMAGDTRDSQEGAGRWVGGCCGGGHCPASRSVEGGRGGGRA